MKNRIKDLLGLVTYFFTINCIKTKDVKYNSILIFAPHPDDEIIGLGGLIIQTLKYGGNVFICFLTDGENSDSHNDKDEIKKQRAALTNNVLKQLGIPVKNIFKLHFSDGKVPLKNDADFNKVVSQIKEIIEEVSPEAVFTTAESDYWPYDHVACSQLIKEVVKSATLKTDLWFYWVWTWYHLKPWQILKLHYKNKYKIDISKELKQKQKLMDMYLNPLSPDGIPWSGVLPKSMKYPFSKPFEIIEKEDE